MALFSAGFCDVAPKAVSAESLTATFKKYEQFLATKDSSLLEEIQSSRNAFFAQWELQSDSICGAVDSGNGMLTEIRSIYEALMQHEAESNSARNAGKLLPRYFVSKIRFVYHIATDEHFECMQTNLYEWGLCETPSPKPIKIDMPCTGKNSRGQKLLGLTKEYADLLGSFMDAKRERFEPEEVDVRRYDFLFPSAAISLSTFDSRLFFNAMPNVGEIYFNETMTQALVYVAYNLSGGYYTLAKIDGMWVVKKYKGTWVI